MHQRWEAGVLFTHFCEFRGFVSPLLILCAAFVFRLAWNGVSGWRKDGLGFAVARASGDDIQGAVGELIFAEYGI